MSEPTVGFIHGHTMVKFVHDIVRYLIRFSRNDRKCLAQIHGLDDIVDQESFHKQTAQGVQSS